ncbi:hypothetical protein BdWA1_000939 [Babesia duncani]|uniref:6-Cys domain-containing protein n=1 Tax=Babesia duncani TaxID=323732 RepID=A0AAD9UQE1_9APIC|nr:hypothetical protein BdWA1_000939 [Babesia duncani]
MNGLIHCVALVLGVFANLARSQCTEFLTLDIANIDANQFRIVDGNGKRLVIPINDDPRHDRCIGDVADGQQLITPHVGAECEYRAVYLTNLGVDPNSPQGSELLVDENDKTQLVQVHTRTHGQLYRLRFFKTRAGKYIEAEFHLVPLDICGWDFDNFHLAETTEGISYTPKHLIAIGSIVCEDKELLPYSPFIYSRSVKQQDNLWIVSTTPVIGSPFDQVLLPLSPDSGEYRVHYINGETLDLSLGPDHYYMVASECGDDCIFYDGCSDVSFIIDAVTQKDEVIFFDPEVHCLDAKLETFGNERHLSIYVKYRTIEKPSVWFFISSDNGPFNEPSLGPQTLDVASAELPAHVQSEDSGNVVTYTVIPRHRLHYVIATVVSNGHVIFDYRHDLEKLRNVKVEVMDNVVAILIEYAFGHPQRLLYQIDEDGTIAPFKPNPLVLDLSDFMESDAFKVNELSPQVYKITTASPLHKIGTIVLGDFVVYPNQFLIHQTECVYSNNDLYLTSTMYNGAEVRLKYTMQDILNPIESCQVFVEQHKESIALDISKYATFANDPMLHVESSDLYMRVQVKDPFTRVIGTVSFANKVLIPQDNDAVERQIYLGGNGILENIHIKTCNVDGDCYIQSFTASIKDCKISFSKSTKQAVPLDLDPNAQLPLEIHLVDFGAAKFFRIKDEFAATHKIGNVNFKEMLLEAEKPNVDVRLVNLQVKRHDDIFSGLYKLMDIGILSKFTCRHELNVTGNNPNVTNTLAPLEPLTINTNLCGPRERAISVRYHYGVYTFNVPWSRTAAYSLEKISFETSNHDTIHLVQAEDPKDNLSSRVFVRMHNGHESGAFTLQVNQDDDEPAHYLCNVLDLDDFTVSRIDAHTPHDVYRQLYHAVTVHDASPHEAAL